MKQSWKQDIVENTAGCSNHSRGRFGDSQTRSRYGSTLGGEVTTTETRIRNKEAKGSSTLMGWKELDVLGWCGNGLAALS